MKGGPKLVIKGAPEYDRHDDILRFTVWQGKQQIPFSISVWAVKLIALRQERAFTDALLDFALAGRVIDEAIERVFDREGRDTSRPYHIDVGDLPTLLGLGVGNYLGSAGAKAGQPSS